MKELTAEYLRSILDYNPDTGQFTWACARRGVRAGSVAGSKDSGGYVVIRVDHEIYKAHRLTWLWMTGQWPVAEMDHINGARDDNRWVNLREATFAENQRNKGRRRDNTSGFKGAHWCAQTQKWRARIVTDGKTVDLGRWDDPELAGFVYGEHADTLHGNFARA
jgi:hypothetical protein